MVDDGTIWTLVNACRPGPTGSDATAADTGAWTTATTYYENDRCTHARSGHGQSVYRAKSTHLSAATSEPEVGATWATYWKLWCEGGEDGAGSGDVTCSDTTEANEVAVFYDTGGKRIKGAGFTTYAINFMGLNELSGNVDPTNDYIKLYDDSVGLS